MESTNASASAFGWDFQANAALILMLDDIEAVQQVRVEGEEDIEIKLNNGRYLFSQAKSVIEREDYSNVKSKLKDGIRSLNTSASREKYEKLIYITNSPNPFGYKNTMHAFTYPSSRLMYQDLPKDCQRSVDSILTGLDANGVDVNYFDKNKFMVYVIPFYTDDRKERYKVIKQAVDDFLATIEGARSGIGQELMEIWQKELFENATKKDKGIVITKPDLLWPIVVLEVERVRGEQLLEELDKADVDALEKKYHTLSHNKIERFEFAAKVIFDYEAYRVGTGEERIRNFIRTCWQNYQDEFDDRHLPPGILKILIQLILFKLIRKKYLVDDLRKKVML